jgi:tRNA G46 methylase TrmB
MPSIAHEHTQEIHAYHAVPAWLIRETLNSIPLQPNVFAFIDMGSGKGRALLVASEFPFARIVGVEISRELSGIAETEHHALSINIPAVHNILSTLCGCRRLRVCGGAAGTVSL